MSTTGNDANDELSQTQSLATIQEAIDRARISSGTDIINVLSGSYSEEITVNAADGITILSYDGEVCAISDGGGVTTAISELKIITVLDSDHISIDGLRITNRYGFDAPSLVGSKGIEVSGNCSGITLQNCTLDNIGRDADATADPVINSIARQAHGILVYAGSDYYVSGGAINRYTGDGTDFTWSLTSGVVVIDGTGTRTMEVSKGTLALDVSGMIVNVLYQNQDEDFSVSEALPKSGLESYTTTVDMHIGVIGISISPEFISLNSIGDSEQLTAVIDPLDAPDQSLHWSSSDESIVTVNEAGMVTARSSGVAIISMMTNDGGFTASTEVSVSEMLGVNIANNMTILPNPVTQILKIQNLPHGAIVHIYDAQGKRMMTKESDEIEVAMLPRGIYFLQVRNLPVIRFRRIDLSR